MTQAKEQKSFPAYGVKLLDADAGIVEHIVAVMGNIDRGGDVIHPGAFVKSLLERGNKIKVLDGHDASSVLNVVGKPLELREVGRLELPPELVMQEPDATGALVAKTQFLLDTPEGRGVFDRIKAGAVDEYSIGYDPIVADYSTVERPDGKKTVRNLREVRLWEYSPVVFAMGMGTQTLSAKGTEPEEGKPWRVFEQEGRFCVYKLDGDGNKTGDSLGCHDTREEAEAQRRALYASESGDEGMKPTGQPGGMAVVLDSAKAVTRSEADGQHPAGHYLVVEDADKPSTWHLRVRGSDGKPDHGLMGAAWAALHSGYRGNVYEGPGKAEAVAKLRAMYASEEMDAPKADSTEHGQKAGRRVRKTKLEEARGHVAALIEFLKWADYDEESETPDEGDEEKPEKAAGPDLHPRQKQAMIERLKLELLEVKQ
jgi:HK97 family phage prohead protease